MAKPNFRILVVLISVCTLAGMQAPSAEAWTPESQVSIAESAAQLAPPDLRRQIARHRDKYREGVMAPFKDGDAARHMKNPDGSGSLDWVVGYEVNGAIQAIRAPRSFEEIVYRLGIVSHYLADANNPLNCDSRDPAEGRYFADYLRYMESAEPRFAPVFYGLRPALMRGADLKPMLDETLLRCRSFYPVVGREYRRVARVDGGTESQVVGRRRFDDRSSAFAIAALSYSHAVSDVAEMLRFVWLKAGGGDPRTGLPVRGHRLLKVPRAADLEEEDAAALPRTR